LEPLLTDQWFVDIKPLAAPAIQAVEAGNIRFVPENWSGVYYEWMRNIKDWCISRQLWWGHRIPAWYDADGQWYVAHSEAEVRAEHGLDPSRPLRQDEDVLDTWFSSALWPFSTQGWPRETEALRTYYPTSVLVTGFDIIFFWVARMIMAGLYYFPDNLPMEKRVPFRDVYFTGMVRDKQGRKMSKSLGNSPDLLDLIDKYGADAVRFGILIASPAGNDLLFDEGALEQGRNFNNKLWNALKLVKMWEDRLAPSSDSAPSFAVNWMDNRIQEARAILETLFAEFKLSEALKTLYSLIWDD